MRKIASIFTAVVYLVLSTGLVFNVHYCHGKLERVSLGPEASFCCCESEDSSNSCCKNEQIFIHLDNDEQLLVNSIIKLELFDYVELEKPSNHFSSSCCSEKNQYVYSDFSPPPKLAIWKTNCAYLFYG